jgi:hypothetical protein
MENYTIAITTFSKRYKFISKLIPQIREHKDNKIFVIINGEKDGHFDEEYRVNILKLCMENTNVFPIFYVETRGLSKMWNTALVASDIDNMLILNDDIEILTRDIFDKTHNHILSDKYHGLTKMNGSFSHFIVNKPLMENVGYFDERLLGFGEEDGDITYRLLKMGIHVGNIAVNGLINIVSDVRHDHVVAGIGKYSNFNREFVYNYKYKPDNTSQIKGMFDSPMAEALNNETQYPYEKFFRSNKQLL